MDWTVRPLNHTESLFGVRELAPALGFRLYPQRQLAAALDDNFESLTVRPDPKACRASLWLDQVINLVLVSPAPASWLQAKREQAPALVRLKAHLVREVEVLFRYALSGL